VDLERPPRQSLCVSKEIGDRIIDHLKLQFVVMKPPTLRVFEQVALL